MRFEKRKSLKILLAGEESAQNEFLFSQDGTCLPPNAINQNTANIYLSDNNKKFHQCHITKTEYTPNEDQLKEAFCVVYFESNDEDIDRATLAKLTADKTDHPVIINVSQVFEQMHSIMVMRPNGNHNDKNLPADALNAYIIELIIESVATHNNATTHKPLPQLSLKKDTRKPSTFEYYSECCCAFFYALTCNSSAKEVARQEIQEIEMSSLEEPFLKK